jgi:hypothetical protein
MRWENFDGDGYYGAESGGVSLLVNTNARQVRIFMSAQDANDFDLAETKKLLGDLGLAFLGSDAELAYAIVTEDLAPFTVGVEGGTWTFTANF